MSSLVVDDSILTSIPMNYTIHVNNMTLSQLIVTNETIELYGLSSVGSRFTNMNNVSDARIEFYNLDLGLTIRNINTSTNLFSSSSNNQNFSALLLASEILAIEDTAENACNSMIEEFGVYPILIGLIGFIILIGGVIIALSIGLIDLKSPDSLKGILFGGMLIVVLIAVLIIVGIFLMSDLCTLL